MCVRAVDPGGGRGSGGSGPPGRGWRRPAVLWGGAGWQEGAYVRSQAWVSVLMTRGSALRSLSTSVWASPSFHSWGNGCRRERSCAEVSGSSDAGRSLAGCFPVLPVTHSVRCPACLVFSLVGAFSGTGHASFPLSARSLVPIVPEYPAPCPGKVGHSEHVFTSFHFNAIAEGGECSCLARRTRRFL